MTRQNPAKIRSPTYPSGAANIELAVEHIRSLGGSDLRMLWRKTFKRDVPQGFTRDLQVRMLVWDVQEGAFGGHDRETLKALDSYARGRPDHAHSARRIKPGTELIREYQGERHCVTVLESGYRWRGVNYKSLSVIARAITGSSWNGPRFFGLRADPGGLKMAPKPQIWSHRLSGLPGAASDTTAAANTRGGPSGE